MECNEDNFLSQVTENPARGNAVLKRMLTNTSELIGDTRIESWLDCSDHSIMEFTF